MAKHILMPQVGQDLSEGKVIAMHVAVGDTVKKGEIVAEVESEKATFEVEAFEEGTVTEVCFGEGEMALVLKPLITLDGAAQAAKEPVADAAISDTPETVVAAAQAVGQDAMSQSAMAHGGKSRSTPLARRVMKQHDIEIGSLSGTGPGGAIVLRDVEAAIAAGAQSAKTVAPAAPARPAEIQVTAREGDTVVEFSRMRQIIADRLQLSKQTIPHFYLQTDVDVTRLLARRSERNETGATKISVNDVVIQAVARCLLEFRNMNAHVSQSSVTVKGDINIGMAVSVDEGLMVPVIANADQLSLEDIAEQSQEAARNARRGISKSNAVGTFTVSNLGMFGVEVFPIINPPEAAILGVGTIRDEVKPFGAGMAVRKILKLVISGDHRAVDGAYAAQFLAQLKQDLEGHNLAD